MTIHEIGFKGRGVSSLLIPVHRCIFPLKKFWSGGGIPRGRGGLRFHVLSNINVLRSSPVKKTCFVVSMSIDLTELHIYERSKLSNCAN